jgi:hypothetical protein
MNLKWCLIGKWKWDNGKKFEQSMHPRSLRKVGQQLDMRKKWDNWMHSKKLQTKIGNLRNKI